MLAEGWISTLSVATPQPHAQDGFLHCEAELTDRRLRGLSVGLHVALEEVGVPVAPETVPQALADERRRRSGACVVPVQEPRGAAVAVAGGQRQGRQGCRRWPGPGPGPRKPRRQLAATVDHVGSAGLLEARAPPGRAVARPAGLAQQHLVPRRQVACVEVPPAQLGRGLGAI